MKKPESSSSPKPAGKPCSPAAERALAEAAARRLERERAAQQKLKEVAGRKAPIPRAMAIGRSRASRRISRHRQSAIRKQRPIRYLVTTTVVPTLTRPNRSVMSWLYIRMQP